MPVSPKGLLRREVISFLAPRGGPKSISCLGRLAIELV